MVFPEEAICRCGIYYEEQITYRSRDDLPPQIIYPPRCTKCKGLITLYQKEERAKHMDMALEIVRCGS